MVFKPTVNLDKYATLLVLTYKTLIKSYSSLKIPSGYSDEFPLTWFEPRDTLSGVQLIADVWENPTSLTADKTTKKKLKSS